MKKIIYTLATTTLITTSAMANLLPPTILSVKDAGYGNGNNCKIEINFAAPYYLVTGFDIERKANNSQTWVLLGRVLFNQTSATYEIAGEKEGLIRMRSYGTDGGSYIDYSPYTDVVAAQCIED
jgi:hypothetical protein